VPGPKGDTGPAGPAGAAGKDGAPGRGIVSTECMSGNLVIKYTDGSADTYYVGCTNLP
jgi:hypothetical protein